MSGKVFIQRDYSSGTRCQFQTKFPAELENRIDRQQFEETVRTLNNLYAEAEKLGGQSYLEGCLACLTAYTIFLCMETHYEKVLKKVSKYPRQDVSGDGGGATAAGGPRRRSGGSCPRHEAAAGTGVREGVHSARLQQRHALPVPDQVPRGAGEQD